MQKEQIPAMEGFFTMLPDGSHLIGSCCKTCGEYYFPRTPFCRNPDCQAKEQMEEVLLSGKGKLWSYTVIYYKPPPPFEAPEPFTPYAVAAVELPEGLKVLGRVTGCAPEDLQMGMEMQLRASKISEDQSGNDVVVWAFAPAQ